MQVWPWSIVWGSGGSPDARKSPPYLGTGTSERALWLLLKETLRRCPCCRSQTNAWADYQDSTIVKYTYLKNAEYPVPFHL